MTVYYKMRQILLQNVTVLLQDAIVITKCNNFITKWDSYYKMQRLLEIATVQLIITVQNQSTFSSEYLVFFFLRHFYLSTSTLFNFIIIHQFHHYLSIWIPSLSSLESSVSFHLVSKFLEVFWMLWMLETKVKIKEKWWSEHIASKNKNKI